METVTLTFTLAEAKQLQRLLFQAQINEVDTIKKIKYKNTSNKVSAKIEEVEYAWLR